jgi:hypothetical protein
VKADQIQDYFSYEIELNFPKSINELNPKSYLNAKIGKELGVDISQLTVKLKESNYSTRICKYKNNMETIKTFFS